jgi:ribonuclease P/MRP protein subunit POP7
MVDQKIQKRPLLHPPIPSPRTSSTSPKIIYISASTPFISTVKRVRSLLTHIESRAAGPIDFSSGSQSALKQIEASLSKKKREDGKGRGEEVVMKGTGKAIEKVMRLATWWQAQEDVKVTIRTGSVGAIDDVIGGEEEGSRVRRLSCLEVGVRLR